MNEKIFIIEDDESIRELVLCTLQSFSYQVTAFANAEDALHVTQPPDLYIFDIMLEGISGLQATKMLRERESTKNIPIILLTAKASEIDKVMGLENGADDYITKPFSVLELAARVKSNLRQSKRNSKSEKARLEVQDIILDPAKAEVTRAGRSCLLTLKEFELLRILMENAGEVVNREQLLDMVWGYQYEGESRTLDMHIKTLREKLGDNAEAPTYIQTVRGKGYKLLTQ